jgi:type VI secretion system secreted protein VgrG
MPDYTQADRPLKITTPLGPDLLLIQALEGREEMSGLFSFELSLLAAVTADVRFDNIIGQSVTVEMQMLDGNKRYFNGIVRRFSQGRRDENFLHFRAEVVPKVWLLTKRVQSRIFQHVNIPDILKKVLAGFDVAYELTGTYYPRDFCVQYRESDFDFASRLMEEEGIYYFFKHADDNHQMVVSDSTSKHPPVPGPATAIFGEVSGEERTDMRVLSWEKIQELRSGEYTLWDHCFELPGNHLEAKESIIDSVQVGKVTHKLALGNQQLEIYDYPGAYAQRFDGITPSGGDRAADIQHIFEDRTRTVRLRMEQEEVLGIRIKGKSDCGQFVPGHKFSLERHFDADASYLLTRVDHEASDQFYLGESLEGESFSYKNRFTAIPETLRFRPEMETPEPVVQGTQTATVVGPPGEEIFTDKYGRVKVQFPWDREGKLDADSSCWLRVATPWAGRSWGMVQIPRIGQEVIVDFLEGDPDQPIIVGSVYNAEKMPPYKLPDKKMVSGWKSNSTPGGGGYNEISMNDTKSSELVNVHAQKDMATTVEHNDTQTIHNDRAIKVDGTHNETITKDTNITIEKGPYKLDVQNNTHTHHVKSDVIENYDANQQTKVAQNILTQSINATITIDAKTEILLHCGNSMMSLKEDGTIVISGKDISILGSATVKAGVGNQNMVCDVQKVTTSGAAINSNAVGMHTITGAVVKIN